MAASRQAHETAIRSDESAALGTSSASPDYSVSLNSLFEYRRLIRSAHRAKSRTANRAE
jgi:hypothetical protein